ncbi:Na(+)/H(+) antiporter subunit F [Paenibacillus sp. 598K]|uniref:Na(+)/H(+) antiporter subunit F1 n=1 Tax=Paenibacillus sp. 598K TaxID=1117987 RepID=UPI000FF975B6|nr:Na(+)/H(+) antiporter subunit F1 [Paenibacillus sp. 598K]GBF73886.1 Na(+)/H(+) antiporter subunit F [Paenibacillus sp. 598K]
MLDTVLYIAIVILSLATLTCLFRVIKGPSMPDRIVALDTIGINLIGMVTVLSIMFRTTAYLELILLIGILAFLSTVAFSKFIQRGVVINHGEDSPDDR